MSSPRSQTRVAPSPNASAPLERESPLEVVPTPPPNSDENGAGDQDVIEAGSTATSKAGRITEQLSGLSEDVREWAELRMELLQTEITEQVEFRVGQLKQGGVVGAIALVLIFFALVTLALGLGMWLGHAFWGFLAVTGLLALIGLIAWMALKPIPPGTKN